MCTNSIGRRIRREWCMSRLIRRAKTTGGWRNSTRKDWKQNRRRCWHQRRLKGHCMACRLRCRGGHPMERQLRLSAGGGTAKEARGGVGGGVLVRGGGPRIYSQGGR